MSRSLAAVVFDSFDILDVRVTRELVLEPGYIRCRAACFAQCLPRVRAQRTAPQGPGDPSL